jgi:hypothetical protein
MGFLPVFTRSHCHFCSHTPLDLLRASSRRYAISSTRRSVIRRSMIARSLRFSRPPRSTAPAPLRARTLRWLVTARRPARRPRRSQAMIALPPAPFPLCQSCQTITRGVSRHTQAMSPSLWHFTQYTLLISYLVVGLEPTTTFGGKGQPPKWRPGKAA